MLTKSLSVSYIDFLWALCGVFLLLFLISDTQKEKAKGNIIDPSQFLIEMTWTDDSPNDVDLWLANPNNDIAYFGTREIGGMTLDTDNLGIGNTYVSGPDGTMVINKVRREVASIRTSIAGTYTVNVLLYGERNHKPEKVKVRVFKLNPYKDIIEKEVVLDHAFEENTIVQFDIDKDGNFISKSESEQVSLFARLKP